jgi:hypothetical protein
MGRDELRARDELKAGAFRQACGGEGGKQDGGEWERRCRCTGAAGELGRNALDVKSEEERLGRTRSRQPEAC